MRSKGSTAIIKVSEGKAPLGSSSRWDLISVVEEQGGHKDAT